MMIAGRSRNERIVQIASMMPAMILPTIESPSRAAVANISITVDTIDRNMIATKFCRASRMPSLRLGTPPFRWTSIMFTVTPQKK
jgi:hypothetical protein